MIPVGFGRDFLYAKNRPVKGRLSVYMSLYESKSAP